MVIVPVVLWMLVVASDVDKSIPVVSFYDEASKCEIMKRETLSVSKEKYPNNKVFVTCKQVKLMTEKEGSSL